MLTIEHPISLLRAATLLTAICISPLLTAQDTLAPDDTSAEETAALEPGSAATAPADQQTGQAQNPPSATPETTDDVLTVDAAGPSSIEFSGEMQIATFSDNVIFRRGAIEILGDTARLERDIDTGELIKVTVEGDPARFSRGAETAAEVITGHSDSIVYYNETVNDVQLSVVEFIGSASFNRGRTAFECTQIKHIIETGATDSPGPCSGLLAPTSQAEPPAAAPTTVPAPDNNGN